MGDVVIDMSMSLDGFIAGPHETPEEGLGQGGERLHSWMFDDRSVFDRVYGDLTTNTGAVILGRTTYDNSIIPWEGKGPLGDVPCFVLTHRPAPEGANPIFTFVDDGIERALALAREVGDKRIGLMGADTDRQYLAAGLVDELRMHIVNVLLGDGKRLFDVLPETIELRQTDVGQDDGVVHITYRIAR